MQSMNIMYTLNRRGKTRMELALPLFLRGIYLVAGILLILVLMRSLGSSHPFIYMFSIAMVFVILSEDRWTFDRETETLRRRTGVVFFAKNWTAPLENIACIEINSDAKPSDSEDPYARFSGAIGKNCCALRFVLVDGRALTVSVASRKRYDALKAQAAALAEFTGKPFIEAR